MIKRIATVVAAALIVAAGFVQAATSSGKFEWTTKSAEARRLIGELQGRIENFQFGTETTALAQKLEAADPQFAMGIYYLSAVAPPPENQKHLDRAVELAKKASEGERRFIDAMVIARANQGANAKDAIPPLEKLGAVSL